MLRIAENEYRNSRFCDGISRRNFLNIGTLAALGTAGGWSLPDLLKAEEAAGIKNNPKSVIMIYLVGGPPHQDMFDLKPEAPAEVAGPWRPIATNVPGMDICEAFPKLARLGGKLTIIRSLVGNQADHDAVQVFNGRDPKKPGPSGGWPQFGSMASKVLGAATPTAPPFVSLCYPCTHGPYNEPGPGFLGTSYAPFRPMGSTKKDMVLNGVSLDRLADRESLLQRVDQLRRDTDSTMSMSGMDTFTEQAIGLLSSSRLALPRHSIYRRKIQKSLNGMALEMRPKQWTATAHHVCRRVCLWLADSSKQESVLSL